MCDEKHYKSRFKNEGGISYMRKLLVFVGLAGVIAGCTFVVASPLEERLSTGPRNIELIRELKKVAEENIEQKLEYNSGNVYYATACK